MKKLLTCVAVAGSLAACNAYNPTDRAIGGGLIGAGTGAVIGGLATGRPGGALAGAAIGGAGGAIIGAATTPRGRYRTAYCRSYDDWGNPVRVPC